MTVVMTTGAAIVDRPCDLHRRLCGVEGRSDDPLGHRCSRRPRRASQPAAPNALAHVGVAHAIVGTLEEVGLAAVIGVPIALATAIFLNEVGGKGTRIVRTVVTAMSGLPSIVAGLFIYSIFIINHVLSYSGFAASLALFVMLLPSVTRTTEEVLRVVPSGLREASAALGAPEWRTTWSVVLPTARSGVVTAVLLGIARIVGETAPLLFTAFGSQIMNTNPFSQSSRGPSARGLDERPPGVACADRSRLPGSVRAHVARADPLRGGPDSRSAHAARVEGRWQSRRARLPPTPRLWQRSGTAVRTESAELRDPTGMRQTGQMRQMSRRNP